jgi:hypothetical protein
MQQIHTSTKFVETSAGRGETTFSSSVTKVADLIVLHVYTHNTHSQMTRQKYPLKRIQNSTYFSGINFQVQTFSESD